MAETIDQTIRDTNTQIFTERGFRLAAEPKITMPTEKKEVEELLTGKSDLDLHRRDRGGAADQARRFQELHGREAGRRGHRHRCRRGDPADRRPEPQLCGEGRGRQGRIRRPRHHQFQGHHRRHAVRRRHRREHPGRDRLEHLHSGLRGAADRHRGGRNPHPEGVTFPKNYASAKLAGQAAEFETTATRSKRRRRPRSTTSSPRRSASNCSTS